MNGEFWLPLLLNFSKSWPSGWRLKLRLDGRLHLTSLLWLVPCLALPEISSK